MKEIKKLPKAPSPVKVLNQKSDKKHYTSCTKFAAMNGISLDTGMLMTLDEVNEVEEESKKR
jgi:hypothetical protein